jgi:hypothetical protein
MLVGREDPNVSELHGVAMILQEYRTGHQPGCEEQAAGIQRIISR